MKRNSRLSLALHTLGHMAVEPNKWQTSTTIAEHAGTNPVVVRRVLGKLREAGLLTSEKGHAKGWLLARSPKQITLADIYIALEERIVASDRDQTASHCSVEHSLHRLVSNIMEEIENSLMERLAAITIADIHELQHQSLHG